MRNDRVCSCSLQHSDVYLISTKSFAAHLTGMCCAMEYRNDPELLRLLQEWLNGKKEMEKPNFSRKWKSIRWIMFA